jgi:hypothetical protein
MGRQVQQSETDTIAEKTDSQATKNPLYSGKLYRG